MRKFLVVLILIMTVFIFSNSLKDNKSTMEESNKVAEIINPIVNTDNELTTDFMTLIRKAAHVIEFFTLGSLLALFSFSFKKVKIFHYLCYLLFYILSVAVLDEFLQSFSDRNSTISDVLLDFFSGVCGILITLLIFKFFKFIKNREKKEF